MGAPKANLNASKSIVPAIRRVLLGRSLPVPLQRIITLVDREAEELVRDLGGWDRLTGAERLMVGKWRSARQVELLIWSEVIDRGGVQSSEDGHSWDLQQGLQRLVPFLREQHTALTALGLTRREKPVVDLHTYLKEKSS